jgi:FkbM family methyltransferase
MGLNIIQIGSHKGYDDLTEIVKKHKPEEIENLILVEPQQQFNESLNDCYLEYKPKIENIVITPNENETTTNFYHSNNTEVSSIIPNHLVKHHQFSYQETQYSCMTINNLIKKYNLSKIDILFIDAEGIDDQIIRSIDFEKNEILEIYYENLHINNNLLIEFLKSKNYQVVKNILFNGWTNKAFKN